MIDSELSKRTSEGCDSIFFNNIAGLIIAMKLQNYDLKDWHLFRNSSKSISLTCVLWQ